MSSFDGLEFRASFKLSGARTMRFKLFAQRTAHSRVFADLHRCLDNFGIHGEVSNECASCKDGERIQRTRGATFDFYTIQNGMFF